MGRSGDCPVGREPQDRGGSEPGRSARGGGRAGWALQAFAPPTSRLPAPSLWSPLCTLSASALMSPCPRSSLCVSGSVFSSLSPHFPDHPLHGGVDFRGLGSSSPAPLPSSPLRQAAWQRGSPKLTFRPTPPSSPTFQLPPALGGPSRKPCRCLRLGTSPAELATFPCVLPPTP